MSDSSYAAAYYPWLRVPAPHRAEGTILVPPAGHVAGIYARNDADRGVSKAPANEELRGVAVNGLQLGDEPLSHSVNDRTQEALSRRRVNAIRDFRAAGRGVRVWGARTTSKCSDFKYVPVRRLSLYIEKSIYEGTQWVVFEPNGEELWNAVRDTIRNFLFNQWSVGALHGMKPDEAFFVRCDRTTMTQVDIKEGRLICQIGFAPLKPAEFVILQIKLATG